MPVSETPFNTDGTIPTIHADPRYCQWCRSHESTIHDPDDAPTEPDAVPPPPEDAPRASLAERFLLPPFSVLDARQGYWQARKQMWLALGIQSELGRGENALGQVFLVQIDCHRPALRLRREQGNLNQPRFPQWKGWRAR